MASFKDLERKALAARKKSDQLIIEALRLLVQADKIRRDVRAEINMEITKVNRQMALAKEKESLRGTPESAGGSK